LLYAKERHLTSVDVNLGHVNVRDDLDDHPWNDRPWDDVTSPFCLDVAAATCTNTNQTSNINRQCVSYQNVSITTLSIRVQTIYSIGRSVILATMGIR